MRHAALALLCACLLAALSLASPASAPAASGGRPGMGAGTGGGTGGGGGPSVALGIQSSSPADGARAVEPTATTLWVRFAHNVADPSVAAIDIPLITLRTASGAKVPATIWVYDPNLSRAAFDKRQYVYIDAVLKPATTYVIEASAGMRSRNMLATPAGILAKTQSITFKTAAAGQGASVARVLSSSQVASSDIITNRDLAAASAAPAAVVTSASPTQRDVDPSVSAKTAKSRIEPLPGAGSTSQPAPRVPALGPAVLALGATVLLLVGAAAGLIERRRQAARLAHVHDDGGQEGGAEA